jgi:hypothetical protein
MIYSSILRGNFSPGLHPFRIRSPCQGGAGHVLTGRQVTRREEGFLALPRSFLSLLLECLGEVCSEGISRHDHFSLTLRECFSYREGRGFQDREA